MQNFSERLNDHPFLLLSKNLYCLISPRITCAFAKPPFYHPSKEVSYVVSWSSFRPLYKHLEVAFFFFPMGAKAGQSWVGLAILTIKHSKFWKGTEKRLGISYTSHWFPIWCDQHGFLKIKFLKKNQISVLEPKFMLCFLLETLP